MHAIAQIQVNDLGLRASQRTAVDAALAILDGWQLQVDRGAVATELEGPLEDVMHAVRDIHAQLHAAGHARISTSLTVETRSNASPSLERGEAKAPG